MNGPILISTTVWFLVLVDATASHAKFRHPVLVYGVGGIETCGSFIRLLNTPNYIRYFDYAAGFITAQNMRSDFEGDVLDGANLNGAMLVVEKYCRDNPVFGFFNGLNQLIGSFRAQ
ncbi:hypothetical protein D3C77_473060 [compost metagenome]